MAQFTPGPWHVSKRYPFWVDDAENLRVVDLEMSRHSVDEAMANARLIAAAPELMDALVEMVDAADNGECHLSEDCDVEGRADQCNLCQKIIKARAAIATARGEASQ